MVARSTTETDRSSNRLTQAKACASGHAGEGTCGAIAGVAWTQVPSRQVSSPLQALPSLQIVPSATTTCWQPRVGSQRSAVHGLRSSQAASAWQVAGTVLVVVPGCVVEVRLDVVVVVVWSGCVVSVVVEVVVVVVDGAVVEVVEVVVLVEVGGVVVVELVVVVTTVVDVVVVGG